MGTESEPPPVDSEPTVIKLTKGPWMGTLKNNPLMGCTTPQLLRTLLPMWREIDYHIFFPRLLMLFAISIMNNLFALIETIFYSRVIERATVPGQPLFVLGVQRSGTTLLHNLLSLDDNFITPKTCEVGFPSSFLIIRRFVNSWPLCNLLSETRPMDNIPLTMDSPQEDEIATSVLSGGASLYVASNFTRDHRRFIPLMAFDTPTAALHFLPRWRRAFHYFMRKISLGAREGQRLLLKSPVHTARLRLLDAEFDHDARFVVVHRHPYDIFQSNCNALVDRFIRPCTTLQTFDAKQAQRSVLEGIRMKIDAFKRDRAMLSDARITAIAYEDLVRDRVGVLRGVYANLGLEFTSAFEQKLKAHETQTRAYRRNAFIPLSVEAKGVVQRQWAVMFECFGYEH